MARATRAPEDIAVNLDLEVIWQQEELGVESVQPSADDLTYISLTRGTFGVPLTAASVEEKSRLVARRDACEARTGQLIVERQIKLLEFATRLTEALLKLQAPVQDGKIGRQNSFAEWLAGPHDRRFHGRDANNIAGLVVAARTARAAAEDRVDTYRTDACSFFDTAIMCSPAPSVDGVAAQVGQVMLELILVGALAGQQAVLTLQPTSSRPSGARSCSRSTSLTSRC